MLFRKLKRIFKWGLFLSAVFLASFTISSGAADSLSPAKILGQINSTADIITDLGTKAENSAQSLTADLREDDTADLEIVDDGTDMDSDSGIDADEGEAASTADEGTPLSALDRAERLIFLKKAVQAKINSKNYVKL